MSKKWSKDNSRPKGDTSKSRIRTCVPKLSEVCLGEFYSSGPGHRVCPKCKELIKKSSSQSSHSLNIMRK